MLYEVITVMGLDIHQRVDAVVGLGIAGIEIGHLLGTGEKTVEVFLDDVIMNDIIANGPVTRIKHRYNFV